MPTWEVCMISHTSETAPGGGFFERRLGGGESPLYRWQVVLFAPSGERKVIAETNGWKHHTDCDTSNDRPGSQQLRGLIAQRGLDGWEPMPLVQTSGIGGNSSSSVGWYFKRQRPGE